MGRQQTALPAGKKQQAKVYFAPGQAGTEVTHQYCAVGEGIEQLLLIDFRTLDALGVAGLGHELAKPGQQQALVTHATHWNARGACYRSRWATIAICWPWQS